MCYKFINQKAFLNMFSLGCLVLLLGFFLSFLFFLKENSINIGLEISL